MLFNEIYDCYDLKALPILPLVLCKLVDPNINPLLEPIKNKPKVFLCAFEQTLDFVDASCLSSSSSASQRHGQRIYKKFNRRSETIRSCSIGINRFRLVGLVEFFRVLLAKNRFRLIWLLNFFNPHQTGLKRLNKKQPKMVGKVFYWKTSTALT